MNYWTYVIIDNGLLADDNDPWNYIPLEVYPTFEIAEVQMRQELLDDLNESLELVVPLKEFHYPINWDKEQRGSITVFRAAIDELDLVLWIYELTYQGDVPNEINKTDGGISRGQI